MTEAVGAAVAQARPDVVYACGPVGMLEAVERQCDDLGLPHQLSWEAIMRCGMGLCGACERHGNQGGLAGLSAMAQLTVVER